VQFVDVPATMLGASLPLTPPERLELGDPIHGKAAFETIRAYSPIDNALAQHYPAILALAGLTDPRDLLGARQMGRPPARDNDWRRPNSAAHRDGRGICARVGALRPA
jgi:hypothetical protein